jgi:hypothetical protein
MFPSVGAREPAARRATDEQLARLFADLGLGQRLDHLNAGLETVPAPWGHPVSQASCNV